MYEDLKEKAIQNLKKQRNKKRAVQIVGVVFVAVSIILYIVSLNFYADVAFWIKFPIIILALVYAIIYAAVFGIPFISLDDELTDEEIEREIVKIYKLEGSIRNDDLDIEDELELKEIEALKRKWDEGEEFV